MNMRTFGKNLLLGTFAVGTMVIVANTKTQKGPFVEHDLTIKNGYMDYIKKHNPDLYNKMLEQDARNNTKGILSWQTACDSLAKANKAAIKTATKIK